LVGCVLVEWVVVLNGVRVVIWCFFYFCFLNLDILIKMFKFFLIFYLLWRFYFGLCAIFGLRNEEHGYCVWVLCELSIGLCLVFCCVFCFVLCCFIGCVFLVLCVLLVYVVGCGYWFVGCDLVFWELWFFCFWVLVFAI
jgi:hypothetical protein